MHYAIVSSDEDLAGKNIMDRLLEKYHFEKITESEKIISYILKDKNYTESKNITLHKLAIPSVDANDLDKDIPADYFIFATRHQSKEGVLSLSCHAPGNWDNAAYGGIDKKLSMTSATLLKKAFLAIKNRVNKLPGYEATLESTHHGPSIDKPAIFIEIGSSIEQWQNKAAGEIIAESIMEIITDNRDNTDWQACIGIGGTHYCANFNKVLERTDYAISHICPKHNVQFLHENMIKQAIDMTKEKIEYVLLDWKGLGQEKERITNLLQNMGLKILRADKTLKL